MTIPDEDQAQAYAPTFSTALHPDLRADVGTPAALRACIDLPGLVRTHGLRMIVSAGAVAFAADDIARAAAHSAWTRAGEGYAIAAACFAPGSERLGLHPDVIEILVEIISQHRKAVEMIHDFPVFVQDLMTAIESGQVGDEYDRLMRFTYESYVPRLTEMEAAIKSAVGDRHANQVKAADTARRRAQDARGQISGIARMVRLISLNARVEAARSGEAGRAFSVIASEIRALSERTETAAGEMGASIDAILEQVRTD